MNNLIIYYFSGTGNARHVAEWIKQSANQYPVKTKLYDISKLKNRKETDVPDHSLIGFISPTHGFNFPAIMFHFLLRFPKALHNPAFIINTRAGMKAGKFFLPGLSGLAQYFSAILLKCKGYKVVGMHPVDLPSNWISLHPGLREKVIDSIYERRRKETEKFAQKIFNGKKDYKALWDIIQDILITPVGILYYFFGRFFLAKTFIASKKCNHCNLCVKECPVQAIKLIDKRPFWSYTCESCMHCMNRCPQRAIETAHGYIAGLLFVVNSFVLYYLYRFIPVETYLSGIIPSFLTWFILLLINSFIILLCLILSYRILHYLLRFRIFERIVVYSSLTTYKFWRRYKSPKS